MSEDAGATEVWMARANDLYWNSALTVEEIIDDVGVSRSSLYAAIEPVPADLVCTHCDERMVYVNRTARERGHALCPGCGREAEADGDAAEESGDAVIAAGSRQAPGEPAGGAGFWWAELAAVSPRRVMMVGGAAALGMVMGAVAARALRPGS